MSYALEEWVGEYFMKSLGYSRENKLKAMSICHGIYLYLEKQEMIKLSRRFIEESDDFEFWFRYGQDKADWVIEIMENPDRFGEVIRRIIDGNTKFGWE